MNCVAKQRDNSYDDNSHNWHPSCWRPSDYTAVDNRPQTPREDPKKASPAKKEPRAPAKKEPEQLPLQPLHIDLHRCDMGTRAKIRHFWEVEKAEYREWDRKFMRLVTIVYDEVSGNRAAATGNHSNNQPQLRVVPQQNAQAQPRPQQYGPRVGLPRTVVDNRERGRPTDRQQPQVNHNNNNNPQRARPQQAAQPRPRPQTYHVDNRERGYLWNRMMVLPTRPDAQQQPETNNYNSNGHNQRQANTQANATQPRQRPHSYHVDNREPGYLWNKIMVSSTRSARPVSMQAQAVTGPQWENNLSPEPHRGRTRERE